MKNIFTNNIYQRNPIANLFKELYFPLKSKNLSESSSYPIPTTIAKFFEIIAYHFDLVYKERVLILNSSFPSNSQEIIKHIIKPEDPDKHDYTDLTDPININNAIYSRFSEDIEKFAKERGLYRINNEKITSFHSRIINAHRFLITSPTLHGLKDLITTVLRENENILGVNPPKFTIRELYTEDWVLYKDTLGLDNDVLGLNSILRAQNWILSEEEPEEKDLVLVKYRLGSESILGYDTLFYFIVDFENNRITLDQKKYLNIIINLYKPAHIGFHINAFIQDDWILDDKSVEQDIPYDEKLGINTYIEKR